MNLRRILRLRPAAPPALDLRRLHTYARGMSDRKWLGMLVESAESPVVSGLAMPPFPDAGLQQGMVGSAGATTMRAAFPFYREVKAACGAHGRAALAQSDVLDFGCGWGRHLRFFLKDVPVERLQGVDVDAQFVEIARAGLPGLRLAAVRPLPPTEIPAGSLDLVYAYSVFSHLAEHAHQAWVTEFHRLLRPGGMLVVTTQRRAFIDWCEAQRQGKPESLWLQALAKCFVDVAATKRDYDDGKFLYAATGGGAVRDASFYGEAIVSPGYVRRSWADRFEILDFIDDAKRDPQAIILARKRS